MTKRAKTGLVVAGLALTVGAVVWITLGWDGSGPGDAGGRGNASGPLVGAADPLAMYPAGKAFVRVPPREKLSGDTYVGTDSRMYSSYDTDGDGLFDADEIRQFGTLMYLPDTRNQARTIEYYTVENPDDTDGDGLPDEWERGYFGSLAPTPTDDPDGDGFPNRIEFAQNQSPVRVDLMDVRRRPAVLWPGGAGQPFSTRTKDFWDAQTSAAARLKAEREAAVTQPASQLACRSFHWTPRKMTLGPRIERTCPADHPYRKYINRSLRPEEDTDGDLLADEWEQAVFRSLEYGRHDDPDGDGFPNVIELYRGTRPTAVDVLPLSMKPESLVRLSDPTDPWDLGWDIRSAAFWLRQEQLGRSKGVTR